MVATPAGRCFGAPRGVPGYVPPGSGAYDACVDAASPYDSYEAAWQAVEAAVSRAEVAEAEAERAAEAAARLERLAASGSRAARIHVRVACRQRESERCQRTTARLQRDFAWLMAAWAARHDPESVSRPVLMNAVARTVRWRDALLLVRDWRGSEKLVAVSNESAGRAHELEAVLGEGPSWEATQGHRCLRAVGDELQARWPLYGEAVYRLGVQAVAAVPVHLGVSLTGGLVLTGQKRGEYGSARLLDIAAALRQCLLSAPDLMCGGEADAPEPDQFADTDLQPALHQAAGMIWERTGVPIEDAIDLIRAHAYAEDRPVAAVAAEVLRGNVLEP